jgi:hypothetical protein
VTTANAAAIWFVHQIDNSIAQTCAT